MFFSLLSKNFSHNVIAGSGNYQPLTQTVFVKSPSSAYQTSGAVITAARTSTQPAAELPGAFQNTSTDVFGNKLLCDTPASLQLGAIRMSFVSF